MMCEGDNLIFYIPSTDEIMRLNLIKDDDNVIPNNIVEDLTQPDFEKVLRDQICSPVKP